MTPVSDPSYSQSETLSFSPTKIAVLHRTCYFSCTKDNCQHWCFKSGFLRWPLLVRESFQGGEKVNKRRNRGRKEVSLWVEGEWSFSNPLPHHTQSSIVISLTNCSWQFFQVWYIGHPIQDHRQESGCIFVFISFFFNDIWQTTQNISMQHVWTHSGSYASNFESPITCSWKEQPDFCFCQISEKQLTFAFVKLHPTDVCTYQNSFKRKTADICICLITTNWKAIGICILLLLLLLEKPCLSVGPWRVVPHQTQTHTREHVR